MHVNTYQFMNLYAYYSWPNVVLPIIGGKLEMQISNLAWHYFNLIEFNQ